MIQAERLLRRAGVTGGMRVLDMQRADAALRVTLYSNRDEDAEYHCEHR